MVDETNDSNCVSKNIHKVNHVARLNEVEYLSNHIFYGKLIISKIMLVKERINIWCRKYLNIQPLFRTSESVIIASPVMEISLSNIYGNDVPNSVSERNELSNVDGESRQFERGSEDSLMQLVYNYPEKSIWFLSYILNTGIISFLSLGILTVAFTLYYWNFNYEKSPFLTVWLLIHGILQLIQACYRCCYKIILNSEHLHTSNVRILQILQAVKKLTTSKVWKIGKFFSILYYLWFIAGFYWILSFRPTIDTDNGMESFEDNVDSAQLVDYSYILNSRSYLLLNKDSIYSLKSLIKVDFTSTLWSFYLLIMLLCTFRIVAVLFFFYFVFPSVVSNEYCDNKSKAFTVNKLEALPVKTYLEWKNIREREFPTHAHIIQDSCIICLNDFSNDDMTRRLPCNHVFHEDCIDLWLLRNAICPLCQTVLR